jgi:hypothetical protein
MKAIVTKPAAKQGEIGQAVSRPHLVRLRVGAQR